jgi:hypothetical protein
MIQKTIAILLTGLFIGFTPPYPPKDLTVTLNIEAWQNIIDVIDKSNANHLQVKAAQEAILQQLQKQLADTTNKKK